MNPYDKAHELARLLKETQEFQSFVHAQKLIEQDPQAKAMLKEFYKKQMETQHDAMRGISNKEKQEQVARMYDTMRKQATFQDFFAAEMKFGRLVTDIQGILSQAIAEGCHLVGKLQDAD